MKTHLVIVNVLKTNTNMANTIEVTGCGDCPMIAKYVDFIYDEASYYYCQHPSCMGKESNRYLNLVDVFYFCPLKQSSITITLKTKENDKTN